MMSWEHVFSSLEQPAGTLPQYGAHLGNIRIGTKDVKEFYLGFSESGHRRNMRDVKHYKRRKRWLS